MNPNKINPSETAPDNQQTGWEIVEAEAGKMNEKAKGKTETDSVVADESKAPILAALREKIKQINRVKVSNSGGSSKGGGMSIHATKMPFGRKVGVGVLSEDYDDEEAAVLNAVHVEPKYRGKGIGGAIVQEAIAQARKEGLKRINLNSTDMAVEMYKKYGFKMNDEDRGSMTLELEDEDNDSGS